MRSRIILKLRGASEVETICSILVVFETGTSPWRAKFVESLFGVAP